MLLPLALSGLALLAQAAPAASPPADPSLPAGQDDAKAVLEKSPRHGEYADIKVQGGGTPLRTWVAYPERKDKAPVVIVIHEIFGLSDWIRAVADRLAADGFIAIAPDLVSGRGPGGGGTESTTSRDEVVGLIRGLKPEEVNAGLDVIRAWAAQFPASTGKTATIGFCWGGSRSFAYAVAQPGLTAAVGYYGRGPSELPALGSVKAPVLGLYGGDDARVNATIEPVAAEMKKLGKAYETEIYEGAGHGFLRDQAGREGANRRATERAWPRTIAFLRKSLS